MRFEQQDRQIKRLSKRIDADYVELARLLSAAVESSAMMQKYKSLSNACKAWGLQYRRALYLIEIGDVLRNGVRIPKGVMLRIGLTKMQIIARYLGQGNDAWLLETAENLTVKNLERALGNRPTTARQLTFWLEPRGYERMVSFLELWGASWSGRSLRNKEKALFAMFDSAGTPRKILYKRAA